MPFNIGLPELLVILFICLIVFGAGKLPGVGRALGQSIREFRQASQAKPEPDQAGSERPAGHEQGPGPGQAGTAGRADGGKEG
ncbi:MAG: twin-arginine translocase TatA/TatE family subunit [Bacillota bacterium]